MKVAALSDSLLSSARSAGSANVQKTFEHVRSELSPPVKPAEIFGPEMSRQIDRVAEAAISGKEISPRELLAFQIRAGQFGLRVELISKMAESGISTLKRLQNPQ